MVAFKLRRQIITSEIGSKRRRLVSLPTKDVVEIVRLSIYALNLRTIEDHETWIRASNKSLTKRDRILLDIEVAPHVNSSLIEVHVHPLDTGQSHLSTKQSLCEEIMKSFFMAFLKIIEPYVQIIDPDITQVSQVPARERRIETREIVRERVLVICPFCGHKNEQGAKFCEQCKASI